MPGVVHDRHSSGLLLHEFTCTHLGKVKQLAPALLRKELVAYNAHSHKQTGTPKANEETKRCVGLHRGVTLSWSVTPPRREGRAGWCAAVPLRHGAGQGEARRGEAGAWGRVVRLGDVGDHRLQRLLAIQVNDIKRLTCSGRRTLIGATRRTLIGATSTAAEAKRAANWQDRLHRL